ncbi:type IX secretion system sortase PorU [Flavihumibacter fluvii]|uniref:type IX secretion system sortase PorU n=1 Tax=Flavihumibacter fluvii TaxID=2838157 RepID=UPI001BDEC612|nr:type IX secretion system sortase PorU [Flavihumibacter fluvii]ULQ51038.1 type IX secretion system sortase PorU [Flavihumibacter fluvii]
MRCSLKILRICLLLSAPLISRAQRMYADHSVLASGNWYKLGIPGPGIYKIDGAFLQQMGIPLPVTAAQIRLFGRDGRIPGEAGNAPYSDDLQEISLELHDGGDGQFGTSDWLAFYAAGAHGWVPDTLNQRFTAVHNIYSDTAFVFLHLGGEGLRITTQLAGAGTDTIVSFQYRYHYENDLYNLLSSGQEWYGERFQSEAPVTLTREIPVHDPVPGSTATLVSVAAARSVDQPASFGLTMNNAALLTQTIAPVTSSNLDLFARESSMEAGFQPVATNRLSFQFSSGSNAALGWINYFDCFAESRLSMPAGGQLDFRSWAKTGPGKWVQYRVSNADTKTRVWRLSDPLHPVKMTGIFSDGQFSFTDLHEGVTEYLAFPEDSTKIPVPVPLGTISNQDLHGAAIPQMILVTIPELLPAAHRLASWHQQNDGINTLVVTTGQAYNEFAGGQAVPTAIRDLVKMFYDRAGAGIAQRPRYLLLLGDASFDYKNRIAGNTNQVPAYESSYSLDPLTTYVSDDYFGLLDDTDDINALTASSQLDIGIGRIPAANLEMANDYVDKLLLYHQPATRGEWRNELSFIADDEDFNLHLRDAEEITATARATNNRFQLKKIYLDAYQQESDAAGSRYPAVNQAISAGMQKGTLIWNYSGHGGFRRLAEEVVLDQSIVDSWEQNGRLPLFITATCDFAPYDHPAINSLGEYLLLKPGSGAIGLMTTTRLVFAFSNRVMNSNYLAKALEPLPGGGYRSLGEAVMAAKNATFLNSGDLYNNLKFTLLGDPALTLAFPKYQVQTDSVNGKPIGAGTDTIRAQQEITITGFVADGHGQVKTDFNGMVFPQVLDKAYARKTKANDPGSIAENFMVQDQVLFKGKATVSNGRFRFSFVVPRDINYTPGSALIRYYAMDSLSDAQGVFGDLPIGGSVETMGDNQGPAIQAWLNDRSFINGGLTGEQPLLLLDLADSSGINVLGNGIGHDITVIIDGDIYNPLVLNAFFEHGTDTYRQGSLQFRLPVLTEGTHTLTIKAWDVLNNSQETSLQFRVKNSAKLVVEAGLAWPNPGSGPVRFGISHNHGNEPLQAIVELFLINGQLVKRIPGTIIGSGNRSYLEWNGKDDRGNLVSPGIYFYRMIIRTADGQEAMVVGRIIRS